ncbi:uncharacterized protein PGTG_18066 [Puccinia graminis f. sp. tritici CRL 75-36-700-3]|uniref:Uncharacterized protein n=1 Tax=Puccinia graminis f. sp. tritici (strain CRL 75-36-700-3 / race SCCL) TaxID=418459 RepID=E3L5P7_PUCGT|nr:uncharacterized protein PGTG_18066 [Puccinia graminis f. sp. tritici CRL 75-36-700-3]EFP91872.1 hypothetical protein PGTG_18066 [Puccinia graminis f. sp. tritici CRL 75-36-700-3]
MLMDVTMKQDSMMMMTDSKSHKSTDQSQEGEVLDLQDFQARLESSIGNIQAMVESWLPKELQTKNLLSSDHPQPRPAFDLDSSRPRNSKLGLGSVAPKQPPSRLTTSKLHSQLTKKSKDDGEAKGERNDSSNPKEQSDEDEDSRTSTLSKKRAAPTNGSSSFSLLQPASKVNKLSSSSSSFSSPSASASIQDDLKPPTGSEPAPPQKPKTSINFVQNSAAGLSKRQLKKMRKLERARSLAANNPPNNS